MLKLEVQYDLTSTIVACTMHHQSQFTICNLARTMTYVFTMSDKNLVLLPWPDLPVCV